MLADIWKIFCINQHVFNTPNIIISIKTLHVLNFNNWEVTSYTFTCFKTFSLALSVSSYEVNRTPVLNHISNTALKSRDMNRFLWSAILCPCSCLEKKWNDKRWTWVLALFFEQHHDKMHTFMTYTGMRKKF